LIKAVEAISASIPLTKTDPAQLWIEEWSNQIFVKLETTDGLIGWGEVLPAAGNFRAPYRALIERIAQDLIGIDETNYAEIWNRMRKMTFTGGYGITTGAISGIDLAIWDCLARKANHSVSTIIGAQNSSVKRYISLSRYAGVGDLKQLFNNLLGAGYRAIKLHQPPSETLESVQLIRKELGSDFDLMVDLNCGFTFDRASDFMADAHRYELKWIEEPLWPPDDFEGLAKLNKLGPVAAGENFFSFFEFKRLAEMDALTYYQPDVAKLGGITPMLDILRVLGERKAMVAFHNRPHNGWIGITASSHLACATNIDCVVESPPNGIPSQYFASYPIVRNDEIEVFGPGFGIVPIEPIPVSSESKLLKFH
jgi:L-alanine-DL-glutamate epimerase-like enolase superfamily enzyme